MQHGLTHGDADLLAPLHDDGWLWQIEGGDGQPVQLGQQRQGAYLQQYGRQHDEVGIQCRASLPLIKQGEGVATDLGGLVLQVATELTHQRRLEGK